MSKLSNFFQPLKHFLKEVIKSPEQQQIFEKSFEEQAGFDTPLHNPDDLVTTKGEGVTIFDKMFLDEKIAEITDLKKKLILSVPYSIEAASDEDDDVEKAEFVQDVMDNTRISWTDITDNLLDAEWYGYKVGEIVWGVRDNKYVWDNINVRHSYFYDFTYDKNGGLDEIHIGWRVGSNKKIQGRENIEKKYMVMVYPYPVDGNYYGESDLTALYGLYYQKYNIMRWRGMYLQGYGMPIPIVKYAKDEMIGSEYDNFSEMLDNWQDNMYLMLPSKRDANSGELRSKFEVEFREVGKGGSSSDTPFDKTIENIDRSFTRRLLIPDKMGFTKSDGGSYALSDTQFDLLKMVLRDAHKRIENLYNGHIQTLINLNFPTTENYPKFKFAAIDDEIEAEILKLLLEHKIIDPHENWIRGKLRVPEITEREQAEIDKIKEEEKKENEARMALAAEVYGDKDDKDEKKQFKNYDLPANYPVDFKALDQKLTAGENEFQAEWDKIYNENAVWLMKQVKRKNIIENADYKEIDKLRIKKGELTKLYDAFRWKSYAEGKIDALTEAKHKIQKAELKNIEVNDLIEYQGEQEWLSRAWVDDYLKEYGDLGKLTADDIAYLKELKQESYYNIGQLENSMTKNVYTAVKEGTAAGESVATISARLEGLMDATKKQYATTTARTIQSDAYNTARLNFFRSDQIRQFVEAYQYRAILDDVTTDFCKWHDGQIMAANDPQVGLMYPPNHFNCRSIMVSIFKGDKELSGDYFENYDAKFQPWGTGVPVTSRLPAQGFGGK